MLPIPFYYLALFIRQAVHIPNCRLPSELLFKRIRERDPFPQKRPHLHA